MIRRYYLSAALLLLALTGCSSAPIRYHTLIAPVAQDAPLPNPAAIPFDLLPVAVPPQVDQPQLVVRQGEQGVAVLDSERWIAGLGDEVRGALAAQLSRDLGAADVSGLPTGGKPVLRIKLDLRRFDSAPGSYALIDAAWSLHVVGGEKPPTLACTTQVSEPVGGGYDALVQGHQRALARLAAIIAVAARQVEAGHAAACPNGA